MSNKHRILFVTQEMNPYTALSEVSEVLSRLPQYTQDQGFEIRILMPRFGLINERRHRLHEVVRLSGMNIIVAEDDYPLIIKVASFPGSRMQVYFLDNDEFFRRKTMFEDESGKAYEDNEERMIFFCKGVLETVKKFGWSPDIVHCHGWMCSLTPLYLKTAYRNEPIFRNSKVIYSVYKETYEDTFSPEFLEKARINNLKAEDFAPYQQEGKLTLHAGAIAYSDALIRGSEELDPAVSQILESGKKPVLEYKSEMDELLGSYLDFYMNLIGQEVSKV